MKYIPVKKLYLRNLNLKCFPMKYSVFISYSRKDSKTVDEICNAFDKNGITYFIDRANISGGQEFPEVIVKAIEECEVFLFIGSKHSYASRFAINEVNYAYNIKPHNSIIPYIIDNSPMPGALRFIFGTVNYRMIDEHPINTILIDDIKTLLKSGTEVTSYLLPDATSNNSEKTKITCKHKHPLFYIGAVTQIILFAILLIFFTLLLTSQTGYIYKYHRWLDFITCALMGLSIIFTTLLPLNKKSIFYGICGLDIIEAICICNICSAVGQYDYVWQTPSYKLLNIVGDFINQHTVIASLFVLAVIVIHCYAMFRILKIKHNGISIWESMR